MMKLTMKASLSPFLIPLILVCASPRALGAAEDVSCADHSIAASAVRTPKEVEAFVQCAYEFVQEVGFEEARRAFHEDERWRSGPIYIFVDEVTSMTDESRVFVFPPNPSREGAPWGVVVDVFGNNYFIELYRIVSSFGEGWIYYSFTNPDTGQDSPKASYVKSLDWYDTPLRNRRGDIPPRPPEHVQE